MTTLFLVVGDANADLNADLARFPHEGDDCPLRARGASPVTAARLGNALGALTAARPGSADALPSHAEARAFLELHGATDALPLLAPRGPE